MSLKELIKERQDLSETQERLSNPTQMWLSYKAGYGQFFYYDKEKKENISLGEKLEIVVLDVLATARGWSEELKTNIIGTEVRNPAEEEIELNIFNKNKDGKYKPQTIDSGIYKTHLKGKHPVDYTLSIYGTILFEGKPILVNLQLKTTAVASFYDAKVNPLDEMLITLQKGRLEKKGASKWHELEVTKNASMDENLYNTSQQHYIELQDYLDQYLKPRVSKEKPQENPLHTPNHSVDVVQPNPPIEAYSEEESIDISEEINVDMPF